MSISPESTDYVVDALEKEIKQTCDLIESLKDERDAVGAQQLSIQGRISTLVRKEDALVKAVAALTEEVGEPA